MYWEEFLKYALHIESISNEIDDGWILRRFQDIEGGYYLVKQRRQAVSRSDNTSALVTEEECVEQFEEHDESLAETETSNEMLSWEYHILYSPSYAVPVLYFNVWNSGGKLLPLDKVWELLNVPAAALAADKWQLVTQQEHPLLLRPFFQLHPCKTAQLLANFKNTKVNPLVTWLSSVGPFVHLYLALQYGLDVDT